MKKDSAITDSPITMCELCYNGLSYNQKQEWAKTDSPITDCPITEWPITDCPITDWAITDWSITDWSITDSAIVWQGFLFGFRASGGRREPFEVWPGRFSTSNQSTAQGSMATMAMSFLLSRLSLTHWDGVRTQNELTNAASSYLKSWCSSRSREGVKIQGQESWGHELLFCYLSSSKKFNLGHFE